MPCRWKKPYLPFPKEGIAHPPCFLKPVFLTFIANSNFFIFIHWRTYYVRLKVVARRDSLPWEGGGRGFYFMPLCVLCGWKNPYLPFPREGIAHPFAPLNLKLTLVGIYICLCLLKTNSIYQFSVLKYGFQQIFGFGQLVFINSFKSSINLNQF